MQREYATERMILFVVGNLPFKRIVQLAEQYLNTTLNPIHSESIRQKADKYVPSEAGYHKHTHQTHIMLGAKAYPIGHPNQAALYLINQMLGGGSLNSRLNLSLREDKGLVYTVESIYNPMSDTGYWAVYLACEPEHAAQCTDIVNQELNRLREKPLSANALSKYLKQAQGQMAIAAENQENNALSMAKNMLYLNYAPTWQEQYSQLEVLTPKCLQGTAIEIFDKQQISILQYC